MQGFSGMGGWRRRRGEEEKGRGEEGERRRRGEEEKGREGVGEPFGILIKMHINGQALLKKDPQVPALAIISFELIGICS
ncbi:MAG: hypothetical protein VKJ09_08475 [Leptolyngbya sp.]|nr:hypothetical protein [Leptolyngbya sp.]